MWHTNQCKASLWHTFLAAISWTARSVADNLWHFYSEHLHCYQQFLFRATEIAYIICSMTCIKVMRKIIKHIRKINSIQTHAQYQIGKELRFAVSNKENVWTRANFNDFFKAPWLPTGQKSRIVWIRKQWNSNYNKSHTTISIHHH